MTNAVSVPEDLWYDVKEAEELKLDIKSVELRPPRGFTAEWKEDQSRNVSLLPGEKWDYEGILFPYLDKVTDTASAVSAVKQMTG